MSWYASTTFWTGAAAIFTAAMAWFTRKSIAEGQRQHRDAREQSERHHQQSFRPLLVLAPLHGEAPLDRSSLLYFDPPVPGVTNRRYLIPCRLQNVGVGPALRARIMLRFNGIDGYGVSQELAPMPPGASRGDAEHPLRVLFQPRDGFNDSDASMSIGGLWELILEYEDVFGNDFHTIHSKNPQLPWTVCGTEKAPRGVDSAVVNERLRAASAGLSDHRDDAGYP
ncbi:MULTISPECIES: hypothetical protein [Metallibacterium]|jgi:hypothetical protein|uniref:hypothetical protein n=1 Tax=Metallibacterium TaxID=1218803 RepID=UPI002611EDD9|nr:MULTISPECIES: hypothetical protein [Metallibacterium]MBW8074461.1 hypothetical protein [Metallibacterium scheffleri]